MTPRDLESLLAVVRQREPRAYLEIGAGRGDAFRAIVEALPLGSRAVSVDYPDDRTPIVLAAAHLTRAGYDVHLVFGSPQAQRVIEEVRALGPFDLVSLGDNPDPRRAAEDWINYGASAAACATPDSEIWRTLRADRIHDEFEGIGVAYR